MSAYCNNALFSSKVKHSTLKLATHTWMLTQHWPNYPTMNTNQHNDIHSRPTLSAEPWIPPANMRSFGWFVFVATTGGKLLGPPHTPPSQWTLTSLCVYLITVSSDAHQKIVRLDISMDEVLIVDILDSANHLCVCVCEKDIIRTMNQHFPHPIRTLRWEPKIRLPFAIIGMHDLCSHLAILTAINTAVHL